MGQFCPKNTFLQIKHIPYLTLLSTTCVKTDQITYVIFDTICDFSRHNSSVLFLAQILHTFYKSVPSKCKFSDFPLLKLAKFLMSFFKQKVRFSSKFGSFFSVIRDNASSLFQLKLYMLLVYLTTLNQHIRLAIILSDLPLLTLKFTKFLMSFLEPRVSYSCNSAHSSVL